MAGFEREIAHRVFADELVVASHSIVGEGERAPTYLLTQLGKRISRVLIVGVLTDVEKVGEEESMWRGRISDSSEVVRVYAGQYQPEAAAALSEIQPPAFVAVIGKVRLYSPDDDTFYVSVRPEQIQEVTPHVRDCWIVDACAQTLRRIEAMRAVKKLEAPDIEKIMALGHTRDEAEDILTALNVYGDADVEHYTQVIRNALDFIAPRGDSGEARNDAVAIAADVQRQSPPAPEPAPAPQPQQTAPAAEQSADAQNVEAAVLGLIGELDTGKGSAWKDVIERAAEQKIEEGAVEEAINALMDKGHIYEPVLGRLKKT